MTKLINQSSIHRKQNINEMLSWSLDKKINHALKRIREFYDFQDGKVYISFSGGKDSTVLLHLVRSLYPDVVAVFSNTTNEYLEILEFIRTVDNVITVNPKMTFNQTVEKYGFPLVSKEVSQKVWEYRNTNSQKLRNLRKFGNPDNGNSKLPAKHHYLFEADFEITSKCCDILKKRPLIAYEKLTGNKAFVGTQIQESSLRKTSWLLNGCNIFTSKRETSRPLSIWTEKDIWEYIHRFNIPYSKIYDDLLNEDGTVKIQGEKRTGCAYCAFGAHLEKSDLFNTNRFQRLALRKPKQYKKMMSLKNNGVSFSEALDFIKVNH